jgi:hypothetical protein
VFTPLIGPEYNNKNFRSGTAMPDGHL